MWKKSIRISLLLLRFSRVLKYKSITTLTVSDNFTFKIIYAFIYYYLCVMTDLKNENSSWLSESYKEWDEVYSTMSERPWCYVTYTNWKFNAYEYRYGSNQDLIWIYDTKKEAIDKLNSLT